MPTDENPFLLKATGSYVKVMDLEVTRSYGGGLIVLGQYPLLGPAPPNNLKTAH